MQFPTILTNDPITRRWTSVSITAVISITLSLWGIYGIGEYGLALFVITPIFIGLSSTIIFGYKREMTSKAGILNSLLSLGVLGLFLILFAVEGLICIAMAAPLAALLTIGGSAIGYAIVQKIPSKAMHSIVLLAILIPTTAFIEHNSQPTTHPVSTKVIINAPIEVVWQNVLEFPALSEPTEFMFTSGIAYPINATIEGSGVGAVRHCNFNTGSFVEPITIWDAPNLLSFSVLGQPEPMKELSFWDVDAPHLHDYFVSKKGQFKLTELPNGQTELEGTTWYIHDIKPGIYWALWSNWIVHSIHKRVLKHIKLNAERKDHELR
jgi:hypothetical protein